MPDSTKPGLLARIVDRLMAAAVADPNSAVSAALTKRESRAQWGIEIKNARRDLDAFDAMTRVDPVPSAGTRRGRAFR